MSEEPAQKPRRTAPPAPRRRRVDGGRPVRPVAQRNLELDAGGAATVAIRSAGLHPLIFRKMVQGPVGEVLPQPGDLVRVVDRDQTHLGWGLWNPRSQIALRLLSRGAEAPDAGFWQTALERAVALRRELLRLDEAGNAYRVVHAESDGLSGLIVDRFDDVLSIECFSRGMYERIEAIATRLVRLLPVKHYRVHVDDWVAGAEDFAARPISSAGTPPAVVIEEHGIRYRVRFEGAHKTGFFCDQRENRKRLAVFCRDRGVLDLCCYTGGFGLNAIKRGGAREVTCVDLDENAIALARENANLNQVRVGFVHADAFGYARQMGANGRKYGAIVLDPPKLIGSRDEISQGKRKYFDLNVLTMGLVEAGGVLLTCSCSGLLGGDEFLSLLRAAARQAGRRVRMLHQGGAAADHPVALDVPETGYLKAVWLVVDDATT